MLTKLEEELKSCQKELAASKEVSKKLIMERNMLEQRIQRLERAKSEEVFVYSSNIYFFLFLVLQRILYSFHISENIVTLTMQKSTMQRIYEDECRKLKAHTATLEQKLESTTQSLNVAESTLALRNTEVDTLQNTLKELDELREFKAVCLRKNPHSVSFRFCRNSHTSIVHLFRMWTERTNRPLRFLKGKEHSWLSLKVFISKNRFCENVTITQLKVW